MKTDYTVLLGSNSYFHSTAKLYRNICFRPGITLWMDENTFIGDSCVILVPELIMHRGSQICAGTILTGREPVVLMENAVVAYGCILITTSDTPEGEFMNDASPEEKRKIIRGPILLRENSFIGSKAVIMPNVTIGERSVVRAQSYISHNVPANMIAETNIMETRR